MNVRPSGFFVLRTPLLAFDELLAWSEGLESQATVDDLAALEAALVADRTRLRSRLVTLIGRAVVREALFVASPDLDDSLDVWRREPDSERGGRIERAIVRYFARMSGRATPFGLFAGSSLGSIGDRTRLVIDPGPSYQRHSRLDADYLFAVADALGRDRALHEAFAFRPNATIYRAGGRIRYVEARVDGKTRTHHLVAVDDSKELHATLVRAADGALTHSLVSALVGDGVSPEEAAAYVDELIESQILRPDLALVLTGSEPTEVMVRRLRACRETLRAGERFETVSRALSGIDTRGTGVEPNEYRRIARGLDGLPVPVELSRLFQVDLIKPARDASIGGAVLEEIIRGLELQHRLTPRRTTDSLSRFRDAFIRRYQTREVPLVEALDGEMGIGFSSSGEAGRDDGPLLRGVELRLTAEDTVSWGVREQTLLRLINDAAAGGRQTITLEPTDIDRLANPDPPPLPDAFAVVASVAASSEEALAAGDFRVHWIVADGPSGARLLGRFCHVDATLRRHVEQHLRSEEALDPEAIFAEVAHLPDARLGNVLLRPLLREYEIPYLGCSGAPLHRQLAVTDLLVSVVRDRIILRSERLGRRVVPRLTAAHNYRQRNLGVYQFLCELQTQGVAGSLGWDWGPLRAASFLPRVACGRLVLALARWHADIDELKRLAGSTGAEQFRRAQAWRTERRLPRWIVLVDGDNRLPIDLDNVLSVDTFIRLIKDRTEAVLTELFPGPDDLYARSPEGRFVHELIVPMVRTVPATPHPTSNAASRTESRAKNRTPRTFAPGSEWAYAKLYTGASTADLVIAEFVAPFVERVRASGAADRWFFIRYADPDWHLRLRVHRSPAGGDLLDQLQEALTPAVADGRIWKVQLDTYEREVERYGGPDGIELAEQIFHIDSEAVLEILDMLEEGDEGMDERWRLTLRGIDAMLDDFGLDLNAKRGLLELQRRELARELHADTSVNRELGGRFRRESRQLELLLDPAHDDDSPLAPGLDVYRRRSRSLAPVVLALKSADHAGRLTQPLAAIVPSFIHMHANRLLRSAHRAQELVLYDWLVRLYESRAKRTQNAGRFARRRHEVGERLGSGGHDQ